MAYSSDWVISDLPVSFHPMVLWCQPEETSESGLPARAALSLSEMLIGRGWEEVMRRPLDTRSWWEASPVRLRTDIPHPRRSQAGGEPLGVREAMELLSGTKRQKETEVQTWSRISVTGFGWKVEYPAGRWGTDMNGDFDQMALGLNIYPPDIRGLARW